MKTLSTIMAAAALGVERKTLDNVLVREGRALIRAGSRGRSRRIPIVVLERIAVAFILNRDIGVSIAKGLQIAERILATPLSPVTVGSLSTLTFDVPRLRAALERSIDDTLESISERTRGRPRS